MRFEWKSSFLGVIDYIVATGSETYRISLRHQVSPYEREIHNGDAERDLTPLIGAIYRAVGAIPNEVVDAFNAWRLAEHAQSMVKMAREPEKYGTAITAVPPVPAHAVMWTPQGWTITSERFGRFIHGRQSSAELYAEAAAAKILNMPAATTALAQAFSAPAIRSAANINDETLYVRSGDRLQFLADDRLAKGHRVNRATLAGKLPEEALTDIDRQILDTGSFSFPIPVATALAEARIDAGLTIADIATRLGVAPSLIEQLETPGATDAPNFLVESVCHLLDLDPHVIGVPSEWTSPPQALAP